MRERFTGTVEALSPIDASGMAAWIAAIPFSAWPQGPHSPDEAGNYTPTMVQGLEWRGIRAFAEPIVAAAMAHFPGCEAYNHLLSVVMPGNSIPPHVDHQPSDWITRVHVPLTTNPDSRFIVGGIAHAMQVGLCYRVNTLAEHSVENAGATPRIHFMTDIRRL